jgi:pimeloyl-ACP methyl ester carboxylesterase
MANASEAQPVNARRVDDVVVLLPGILGSVLSKDGDDIWSSSRGALFQALLHGAGPIADLVLEDDRPEDDDAHDGVTADRLIGDVHLIPGLWTIDGYSKISERIRSFDGIEPGKNYFEFPYDWRRDNRVTSRRLCRKANAWLDAWQEQGHPNARLVLIAHSMGGLVARHFLEVHEGWRRTRKLITIGTPYRGSLQALDFVSNGMRRRAGLHVVDLTQLARSLTSVYQLLPTYECWQGASGMTTLVGAGDIPNVDAARVRSAVAFHEEIADAEHENRKLAEYHDQGYELIAIAGVSQPTLQSAKLDGDRLVALRTIEDLDRDGDGRVMREVSTPLIDEKLVPAWAVNQRHGSLQNDESVLVQIKDALELPRSPLRDGGADVRFGLDLEDLHLAGEPIPVAVAVDGDVPAPVVTVRDTATNEQLERRALPQVGDGTYAAELRPLTPATYRLTAEIGDSKPVVDVFTVTA